MYSSNIWNIHSSLPELLAPVKICKVITANAVNELIFPNMINPLCILLFLIPKSVYFFICCVESKLSEKQGDQRLLGI